jgi:hypothetical protein
MRYSTVKKIRRYAIGTVAFALAVAACWYFGIPYYTFYEGDGAFRDHGVFASERRYDLDLGAIDITHAGKYTYTLQHLPDARFIAGLRLAETLPAIPPNAPPDAGRLDIELASFSGKPQFAENSSLPEWSEAAGLRGRDSMTFVAQRDETYTLTLDVIVPFPARVGASLELQSR